MAISFIKRSPGGLVSSSVNFIKSMKPRFPAVFSAGLRRVSVPRRQRVGRKIRARRGTRRGPVINQPERLKRLESSFPLFLCGTAGGRCLLFGFPGHRCQPVCLDAAPRRAKLPFFFSFFVSCSLRGTAHDDVKLLV